MMYKLHYIHMAAKTTQPFKRSLLRDGPINLSVTDPQWLAARLAPTGACQTWFLLQKTTILGGANGIEAFLDPSNVERANDDSAYDQFKPPIGGPDGPSSLLRLMLGSDCAIPWFINAPVPRIFTILDNQSQPARKKGYMRALTTEYIQRIFYPPLVAATNRHLPAWADRVACDGGELNIFDAVTELVWDAVVTYIYGTIPPSEESHALRVATDALLSSLGKALVFSAGWRAAAAATTTHLAKLRAALSALRAESGAMGGASPAREPKTLLEALAFDTSPHKLSDDEIVYETFHSAFVSLGGFRCWIVNYLMELLLHPQEMEHVVAEVMAAPAGRCCSDFAFLQDGCPRATMGVHETKRTHSCLTNLLFGRARRPFSALGVDVAKGERVRQRASLALLHLRKLTCILPALVFVLSFGRCSARLASPTWIPRSGAMTPTSGDRNGWLRTVARRHTRMGH